MDTQNLNIAQKRMLTYLKNNFPTLPMSVAESIKKTFEAFPDFEIKEGTDVLTVDLDEVKLTNNDRDIVCFYSAKNIVEKLVKDYQSDRPNNEPSQLEYKVWSLTEEQYLELVNREEIPLNERLQMSEIWKRKPSEELDYINMLLDETITPTEKIEKMYQRKGEISPMRAKEIEAEKMERFHSEGMELTDKIDELLTLFDE
ncbi:hypothetical protein QO190_01260 [Cloacibacterium sp. Arc13]|uniref:hypothetical protein n=1 Tax=unclassified Cloacibacterium TaxID=2620870 RepID=UPI00352E35E7